jgi:hypothetical protein
VSEKYTQNQIFDDESRGGASVWREIRGGGKEEDCGMEDCYHM